MLKNGHGDVVSLVSGGTVTKTYDYDAYGVEKNIDPTDSNPFRYCGEYYDKETGSIYLRARYYDPGLGRFFTEDPAMDGDNWYIYANNNPILYCDPEGTSSKVTIQSIYSAIEKGVNYNQLRISYNLSNEADKIAKEYAKRNNPQYDGKKLITWSNKSDALRHFIWNYQMAINMDYSTALKCSTAHEIGFLRVHNLVTYADNNNPNDRYAFMPLTVLMDIWNNEKAVNAFNSGNYEDYKDAFVDLLINDQLITSPDEVPGKYGFDYEKITSKQFGDDYINGYNVIFEYTEDGFINNVRLRN